LNIVCTKNELLNGINIVLKAVPVRTTLPILECILIIAENNFIKLLANNLEMAIETSQINAQVKEIGRVAVDAKKFFEIIKSLPDGDVSLKNNNSLFIIKGGRSEFKISSQTGNDFPELPEVDKSICYKILASDLKDMIKETIFSVSLDESRPVLMGELFEIKNQEIIMVALDGFRIAFRNINIDENYESMEAIIPSKTLSEILKVLPNSGNISIYFTEKHALFELDQCKIVTRLIEGKFLNYENIFVEKYNIIVKVNRQSFLESIARASLIAITNKKNPVELEIKKDIIIITSNTDLDTSYEELPAEINGGELKIAFNPKYLIDVLRVISSEKVAMQFTDELSPCVIKPDNNLNSKYLILPLRLNNS
jgi:DNA polymerase-3 subunit beta